MLSLMFNEELQNKQGEQSVVNAKLEVFVAMSRCVVGYVLLDVSKELITLHLKRQELLTKRHVHSRRLASFLPV
jgi:hypothetical protein